MLQLHRSLAQLHPSSTPAAAALPAPPATASTAAAAASATTAAAAAAGNSGARGQKRSREAAGLTSSSSGLDSEASWEAVEEAVAAMAGFRDATLDKWHRRTVLSSGGVALKGAGLRALHQSISQQVAAAMGEASKLIRRTQLPVGLAPRPLGSRKAAMVGAERGGVLGEGEDEVVEEPGGGEGGGEERDVDTYDDGDFYQQLLKELIDAGGVGAMATTVAQAKRRKAVDRRASKGRKIR